jgi:hypothetical protein
VPFIITQHMQPDLQSPWQHSQQHWIISQQVLSPLVQVILQPDLVVSTLQTPQVRLQVQTGMPFIVKQQETMPPWSMVQRLCTVAQAAASSQWQVRHIPPVTFSNLKVHRGTMTIDPPGIGATDGIPVTAPIPGTAMPVRSMSIADVIGSPPENGVETPNPAQTARRSGRPADASLQPPAPR